MVRGAIGLLLLAAVLIAAVLGPARDWWAILFIGLGVAWLVIAVQDWRRAA